MTRTNRSQVPNNSSKALQAGDVVSGAHVGRLREDFHSGTRNGVNGTPSFFISGIRYDGETGVDQLLEALTGEDI